MAQTGNFVPATNFPVLTKDTIDHQIAQVRKVPVAISDQQYAPKGAVDVQRFVACQVDLVNQIDVKDFVYMWDPPDRRREAINERMMHLGEYLKTQHGLGDYAVLTEVAQDERVFLGIVQSCAQVGGAVTCVVDGYWSPEVSYGANVTLQLDDVPSVALFPGKIFAFKGKNIGGQLGDSASTILVSAIYDPPLLPPAVKVHPVRMEEDGVVSRIAILSGPYGTDEVRTAKQIEEAVMFAVRERHVSCVVLCGPFVPAPPEMTEENVQCTVYDDQFDVISEQFNALAQVHRGLKVIVVPSLRDVCADFVFPQPLYDVAYDSDDVIGASNPAHFILNGDVTFTVSTAPILEHISRFYIEQRPDSQMGRVSRMALQLLQSQSLYPLLPAAADTPLSLDHHKYYEFTDACPDVLVLPSYLVPSAQRVGDTLVINPGLVAKRSFAEVTIAPSSDGTCIADRASVEFFRLP